MRLLQQTHNFHTVISHKSQEVESGNKGLFLEGQNDIPSSSSAGTMDWILIIHKSQHLKCKRSVVCIFFQEQLVIKLSFQKDSHLVSSFWHRCFRAGLHWISSSPFYVQGSSLGLFVEKPVTFYQLLSSSQDMVAQDIHVLLSAYTSFHFYNKSLIPKSLHRGELQEFHSFHLI